MTATVTRNVLAGRHLILATPLFPVPSHGAFSSLAVACAAAGAFKELPIHRAWWSAIGAAVIGLGGLVDPRAWGVGCAPR
jgi:H+/Cl- antiporter ClcA